MLFSFSLKRLNILQMVQRKTCLLLVRGVSDDLIQVCYINASLIKYGFTTTFSIPTTDNNFIN